jgi:hypothetical protein
MDFGEVIHPREVLADYLGLLAEAVDSLHLFFDISYRLLALGQR